jgi:hypothetical protein
MVEKNGQLELTPKPILGAFNQLSRFRRSLLKVLPRTTRMTPQEFLGFYAGRKRERYEEAVRSLEVQPVKAKDAWLSTFVKAEKLNITAKPDPAPRVIQPRTPRYNVEVGRYLRHSEELLFKGINKVYGGRTIFKGLNADEAGEEFHAMWNSFRDPIGIGMDASRFDQHISKEALEFEHSVWLEMFPATQRAELRRLLSWQINNKGLARCPDGEIRYRVEGCRMSGDMNTSSGNCLIMCATVHNWCTRRRVRHFRLANNGDDCMLVVERKDEARVRTGLIEYYRELGFTMKVEPTVDVLEHLEFCQTRPVLVAGSYRMVRNLHQSMSKDLHCLTDIADARNALKWISAVGEGGRINNDGVPVLHRFYQQFPTCSDTVHSRSDLAYAMESWKYKMQRKEKYTGLGPSEESRFSFWLAFGLTPDEQIALENDFTPLSMAPIIEQIEERVSLVSYSRA